MVGPDRELGARDLGLEVWGAQGFKVFRVV